MKTYYLVAKQEDYNPHKFEVFVTDNPNWYDILEEFEAASYDDAVKRYSFRVNTRGGGAYCGVASSGDPYAGKA